MDEKIFLQLKNTKDQSKQMNLLNEFKKNAVLQTLCHLLLQRKELIISANKKDIADVIDKKPKAFIDRLTINEKRINSMIESLKSVIDFPDPIGKTIEEKKLKNDLQLSKIRSPIGVILLVYESRPNVAIEAFSISFKAGNCTILRGGKESQNTVGILYSIIQEALQTNDVSIDSILGITNPDKELLKSLIKQKKYIDLVVPRGGENLIEFIVKNSLIPIIKNDRGLCHVYAHQDADINMAKKIIFNSKIQRPSVCNAMETLLVHKNIAKDIISFLYDKMNSYNTVWYVCNKTFYLLKDKKNVSLATEDNWNTEYLDYKLNCKIVSSLQEAISHIQKFSSGHSEAIITKDIKVADNFQKQIDSGVIYINASTRFTDGFEFGMGGEIGISTQKFHARGPIGLNELTTFKWLAKGNGQIRK